MAHFFARKLNVIRIENINNTLGKMTADLVHQWLEFVVWVLGMSIMCCALVIGYVVFIMVLLIPTWYYRRYIETRIERMCGIIVATIVSTTFYMIYGYGCYSIVLYVVSVCVSFLHTQWYSH